MISSSSNKQIKELVKLQSSASFRRERCSFVIEGVKLCEEVPKHLLKDVYVSENFEKSMPADIKKHIGSYELVSDRVFESMSDTRTPQGIMAVVSKPVYNLDEILKSDNKTLLILEHISDPGNLGTILRLAEASGVSAVFMSKDTVDIYNPKVVRSTMGAIFRMPFIYVDDLEELIMNLKSKGIEVYASSLQESSLYDETEYGSDIALVMGNESKGISDRVLSLSDKNIHIPMLGKTESLNVAIASAVILYEIFRQRRLGGISAG